jgi:NADPH:quinone reductase-like Zn-dependent oxidoreductase
VKAGVVREAGRPPTYAEFPEPVPVPGEAVVRVTAAAISNVVKSRAAGRHSSSDGSVPFVVGVDGVGRLEGGERVYFLFPRAPFGSFSERTVVRTSMCLPLPDGLADERAAAIAIPGMSAWAALQERARLAPGEVVLVNGATGAAGRLAVQVAKHLGAGTVVATARNEEALKELRALGADVTIPLGEVGDAFEEALHAQFRRSGIDVVLDYLWGPSAERVIAAGAKAGRDAVPLRFVHIGAVSAPNISLPSAALRSSAIELRGSGIGSIPPEGIVRSIEGVLRTAVAAGFRIATRRVLLSEVERVWSITEGLPRLVVDPTEVPGSVPGRA